MKPMLKEIVEELGELRKSLKDFLSSLPYVDSKKVAELMQQKEPIMQLHQTPAGLQLVMQQAGEYTLLAKYKRDGSFHEYVVCCQYNPETGTWWHGHYFWHDLKGASEFLRIQTDSNYISKARLEEIATKALHALEENELLEDYKYDLDLDKTEMEFFGISEDEENE